MAKRALTDRSGRRRRAILDAALATFIARGPVSATIEEIRAASGASVGSITHHYGTKEELLAALFEDGLREFHDGFVPTVVQHRSARTGIEAGVRYHVEWFVRNPDIGRFLLHMRESELLTPSGERIRALNRERMRELLAWLRPFQEKGDVANVPVSALTALWIGPCQEYCRQWLSGIATTPPDKVVPMLARSIWRALDDKKS
jgi:AcrR family transcriptional regulator